MCTLENKSMDLQCDACGAENPSSCSNDEALARALEQEEGPWNAVFSPRSNKSDRSSSSDLVSPQSTNDSEVDPWTVAELEWEQVDAETSAHSAARPRK